MTTSADELAEYVGRGLADVEAKRLSDGSINFLDGLDDACNIAREVNLVAQTGKVYVTKEAAENVDELTYDTFSDGSDCGEMVLKVLSVAFRKILEDPDCGMRLRNYTNGLRVFLIDETSAIFYQKSGSDVIIITYIDEHYIGHVLHHIE
ncbi:hypothetical protein JDN40_11755 [Rhodomicrobium vannielii ATCC 17100]|uniref:hypothetical protein n=1 Tax=Rhodomicrobium vannielii TaxID=1069 RepID=UPI00191803A1|nr:hypothetical protein [Rhodomicrobium vannielii]MBJ7534781.1 hypothetical protein [Rhodomicrobium vannielii ATCC 17100]